MNNRHRLVEKLKQRQFMNDVKKLPICVPSPALCVLAGTRGVLRQKIFMSSYIAVQNAMKKLDQRIIKEFSEE